MLADVPIPMLTPRPVARSLDELLANATDRRPFRHSDSKSGSAFEQVVVDGETLVLKHVHVDRDWTMRFGGDVGCHPVQVWAAGLMDVLPDRIDHGVVGVAGGLGRNGWGGAILMRDLSAELVPAGDEPLALDRHLAFVEDLAALSARMLGWQDDVGLMPLPNRWAWFNPACLAVEEEQGWPEPVPRIAQEGWARFAERVPPDVLHVVDDLRSDPSPLVTAVHETPTTFVHGDWKLGNLGTAADGRTVLIDWTYPGEAPPCYELAWYLSINRARLPQSKEDAIGAYQAALQRHGVQTAGWFDRQVAVCLLGSFVIFGWEKALGDDEELAWWCDRVPEGVAML
jgi:Phosphotransferase enzyme family